MDIPADIKYSEEHEWVGVEGNIAAIGITDYAQSELGDIVFVELPEVGAEVTAMKQFGTIEAVKTVSDLYSPLSGKIVEVNNALEDDPTVINRSPYGDGWIIKIEMSDPGELDRLLPAEEYQKLVE
ncbi:MAG: glycine cleavage system protein GcvH [Candidatus Zixiibacteriota bacterium]|nr:MAG: glycine cleavage system protein GcvH [candidate division Zixibacteria bacterium]